MNLESNGFMEAGDFDPKKNPVAAQLNTSYRNGRGIETKPLIGKPEVQVVANVEDVILQLWDQNQALLRAVAVLEDQITELRGSSAVAAENLLHVDEDSDSKAVEGSERM